MATYLINNRDPIREIALESLLKDHEINPEYRLAFVKCAFALRYNTPEAAYLGHIPEEATLFIRNNPTRVKKFADGLHRRITEMHKTLINNGFIEYSLLSPEEAVLSLFYREDKKIELETYKENNSISIDCQRL